LSPAERDIISTDYKISRETYVPSLYGTTLSTTGQRTDQFSTHDVIAVAPDADKYHQMIQNEIARSQQARKPVLVFFATERDIKNFLDSPYGQRVANCSVVTEKTENITYHVQHATIILEGKVPVTIFPRVFGRGTDFFVYDDSIERAGGVHVIQTFFSKFLAEEMQIQGRTARQGKSGTYKMIVLSAQLEAMYNLTASEVEQEARNKATFYEFMFKKRQAAMTALVAGLKETAEKARIQHESAVAFQSLLKEKGQCRRVAQAMMSFAYSSSSSDSAPLHIIFCLDESGSMRSYWTSLVDAVVQFLDIRKACGAADKDVISVIKFADEASLLWDKVAVEYAISNRSAMVRKGVGTNFIPALGMVKQQMLSEPSGMGVAVVFLTDGETARSNEAAPAVGRLQNGFVGSSFQFFGVFFRAGAAQTTGEGVLQDMVDAAGKGKMVLATNVDELKTQFQRIAREVSASYAR
jgi:Mg-chelatase subunit ChlD